MGYFDFARIEGFPTQYAEKKTPVTEDVLESGFIAAFIIILVACFTILMGFKWKNGVSFLTRVIISGIIGLLIMLGNFGQYWEVGHIRSKTPYKAGTVHEIEADIGVNIGLRSVNITLKADTSNETNELKGEIINYNERFEWTWDQGRFGFGPQAGLLQREFRDAQRKGLPLPILWIVDYLVVDGEGLRFGRFYRTAGWYAHIAIWSALPCWMLANLLFLSVTSYGAIFLGLSGFFQLLACILWISIRNSIELVVPFEDDEIKTSFGISFWLTFSGGILSLIVSFVVILADLRFPNQTSMFFGVNSLYDYIITDKPQVPNSNTPSDDQEMGPLLRGNRDGDVVHRYSRRERRTISTLRILQKELPTERDVTEEYLPIIASKSRNIDMNRYKNGKKFGQDQNQGPSGSRALPSPKPSTRPVPPVPVKTVKPPPVPDRKPAEGTIAEEENIPLYLS